MIPAPPRPNLSPGSPPAQLRPSRGSSISEIILCVPEQNGVLVTHRWQRVGGGPWQSTQVFSAIGLERCSSQLTRIPAGCGDAPSLTTWLKPTSSSFFLLAGQPLAPPSSAPRGPTSNGPHWADKGLTTAAPGHPGEHRHLILLAFGGCHVNSERHSLQGMRCLFAWVRRGLPGSWQALSEVLEHSVQGSVLLLASACE